jgi:predicted dehydrogenase
MYKIAILGCENSHANHFLELIGQGEYPDIEVVGIYSNEPEAAKKLHDTYGVPILDHYADMVGKVDGIMITARHGDNHYKYAKPYMDDGIPMFIDKPITCLESDAEEFMDEAERKGIRLCGGSTCAGYPNTLKLAAAVRDKAVGEIRGGALVCPFYFDSPYGGFYFYAQHLVEIMTTIFGVEVRRVFACRGAGELTFVAEYDGYSVTGKYIEGGKYYSASVYGSESMMCEELTGYGESFKNEMNDMLSLLRGNGMKKSRTDFVKPVYIMNAILRSLDSGKWETVGGYKE